MELEAIGETDSMLETPYMKLWIENKILYCIYANVDFNLAMAKECVEQRIKFSKGISYPACVFIKNLKSVEIDARRYFAKEGNSLIKAGALIIESPLSEILGNFFLFINKPNVPARLFTNRKDAEKWLSEYI
jgi:hypothetical protein